MTGSADDDFDRSVMDKWSRHLATLSPEDTRAALWNPNYGKRWIYELDIFANFTPQWHGGHIQGAELTLGQERYDRMFRAQPLIDRDVAVTFSSDITDARRWRANRASPFFGMQVGHTRLEPEFGDKATVRPPLDERLALEDLVRGYTINGAAQLGMADEIGSIEVGKLGHLVVLDRNIFETLPNSIGATRPTAVLMEGELVSGSLATN